MYIFDDTLRTIILRNILKVEKHIKSLISYSFCEVYGEAQQLYLDKTKYNYSPEHQSDIDPPRQHSLMGYDESPSHRNRIKTRRLERTQMYKYMGFPANWLKIKDAPYYDTTETHP